MIRLLLVLSVFAAISPTPVAAQKKPAILARYGVEADPENYPQASAQETLASVLKAIDRKRFDYLLAHLADPAWVDDRVKKLGGKFENAVTDTRLKLTDDPESVKELKRFLREGEWAEVGGTASVKLKDVAGREVFFRREKDRWFLENRKEKEPEKPAPTDK